MNPERQPLPDNVWCVIPVYNNQATVRTVALACRQEVPRVVVVDDGSTDGDVGALLRDVDVVVLRHPQNRGKGQALLTALRYLAERHAAFMITLDADGQHDPCDLWALWAALAGAPDTIVIGARRMEAPGVPAASRFGMRFSDFWLRLETGVTIRDSQSGFRLYPVQPLTQLKLRGSRYDFEVEVLAKAAWAGLHIMSVPVHVTYAARERRVSHYRPWLDNLRMTHRHVLLVSRRLWPWPHRRLVPRPPGEAWKFLRHPLGFCRELLREHATPAELGAAAAVGTFLATLPLLSAHTVAIVYVATRLKLNRLMAVAIQNLCMPPFVPIVCIELGYFFRHGRWLTELSWETLWHQAPARLWEWLLGSCLLAPLLALITGALVFTLAALVQRGLRLQTMAAPGGARGHDLP